MSTAISIAQPPLPSQSATGSSARSDPADPHFEVADIFRLYGDAYLQRRPVPLQHHRVMRHIRQCRTNWLGGRIERCEECGFQQVHYNSCRNRHCPKCQTMARSRWVEARRKELLPVPYFHVVFTLPHALNPIAEVMENKKPIYNLLFGAASETLKVFGENPGNGLGGKIGFTALLHTWDQKLRTHLHLHCIVAGGALSSGKSEWLPVAREDFLFPIRALSKVFRGKFIEGLRRAFGQGDISFPSSINAMGCPEAFGALIRELYRTQWVVYAKPPFRGPDTVLEYLARYTHRVAISNYRLREMADGKVTFTYRDRTEGNLEKECTLSAEEFIRRFLLHVLPRGFMRVRHFGFLANRGKAQNLARCRQLLGADPPPESDRQEGARETMLRLTGVDITRCPRCQRGQMQTIEVFDPVSPARKTHQSRRGPPCR